MKSAAQTATSQGNAGHECMRTIDRAFHASTYRPARTPSFGHPPLLRSSPSRGVSSMFLREVLGRNDEINLYTLKAI